MEEQKDKLNDLVSQALANEYINTLYYLDIQQDIDNLLFKLCNYE